MDSTLKVMDFTPFYENMYLKVMDFAASSKGAVKKGFPFHLLRHPWVIPSVLTPFNSVFTQFLPCFHSTLLCFHPISLCFHPILLCFSSNVTLCCFTLTRFHSCPHRLSQELCGNLTSPRSLNLRSKICEKCGIYPIFSTFILKVQQIRWNQVPMMLHVANNCSQYTLRAINIHQYLSIFWWIYGVLKSINLPLFWGLFYDMYIAWSRYTLQYWGPTMLVDMFTSSPQQQGTPFHPVFTPVYPMSTPFHSVFTPFYPVSTPFHSVSSPFYSVFTKFYSVRVLPTAARYFMLTLISLMDLVLKVMNCSLNMMEFVLKTMDFVLQTMNFVPKMMNFVPKMMDILPRYGHLRRHAVVCVRLVCDCRPWELHVIWCINEEVFDRNNEDSSLENEKILDSQVREVRAVIAVSAAWLWVYRVRDSYSYSYI